MTNKEYKWKSGNFVDTGTCPLCNYSQNCTHTHIHILKIVHTHIHTCVYLMYYSEYSEVTSHS